MFFKSIDIYSSVGTKKTNFSSLCFLPILFKSFTKTSSSVEKFFFVLISTIFESTKGTNTALPATIAFFEKAS